MRSVVAISLLCFFGCDGESRTTKPPTAAPVEVVLERSSGFPRFDIQATFGSGFDPAPHIQPITAALASARAACSRADARPALAAVLDVSVRGERLHATSRNSTGTCLARAIDGTAIDDPLDYAVELIVSVG